MMENSNETLPDHDLLRKRIDTVDQFLNRLEPFGFSGTVLFGLGGEIILQKGYGFMDYERNIPMTDDAVLSIGSIAKQFTSTIILQLQERGLLDTNDRISRYIDGLPEDKQDITIHQILTHTAGLPQGLGGDFEEISTDEFLDLVRNCDLNSKPGENFEYSNVGFSIAAIIAQKVTDTPYVELLQELYEKLGITTASWFGDPKYNQHNAVSYYVEGEKTGSIYSWKGSWDTDHPYWHILGNGGITIAQHDMFNYIQALFKAKLISNNSIKQLLTVEQNNYAYGWDVEDTPLGTLIQHNGGSGGGVASTVKYYQDLDLTVLISSNTIINGFGMAFVAEPVIEQILMGEEIAKPPQVTVFDRQVDQGIYKLVDLEPDMIHIERLKHGPVVLQFSGQNAINTILEIDEEIQQKYSELNHKMDQFGQLMMQKNWEEAFQLAERKTGYERRVDLLEELQQFFVEQHGEIETIQCVGTVPRDDFLAMSLLQFRNKTGEVGGIPFVWNNYDEFLGFRPLLTKYPLIFLAVAVSETEFVGYSPECGQVKVKVSENTAQIL